MLMRYSKDLFAGKTNPSGVSVESSRFVISPQDVDGDGNNTFKLFVNLEVVNATNGATTDVILQGSVDGTHWLTLVTSAQVANSGNLTQIADVDVMYSYVKATLRRNGIAATCTYTIHLVSDSPFSLLVK